MKLGFVSAILAELSLDEVLAFAAAEGFGCVEAMCWPAGKAERKYAGITHVDVTDFTPAKTEEINALCARHGVALSALGYYPNPLDPDEAAAATYVAHLRKVIAAARMLGLSTVNTFVGRDWTKSVDDNWPRFLATWRPLIAFAEENGVRVGIENCPMFFTNDEWPGGKNLMTSPTIWRRAFADIPSAHFGLNFDPSHFALQFIDPASALHEFKEKLFHFHAKDVRIYRERLNQVGVFAPPLEWHQPRLPGYGEIDWGDFMSVLMETGYDGPVCIEVEDDTFGKTLEGRKRALRVARNVLAPFIG
ncbi:MAG TPA: sugar phosphate isomerase/epimerase family protein [Chthoniobacteraceae bacterium]|jgi:sugar phosphate isomerase/epimerase|nr:sugar phosphate isomerase/epimerase family protein [Chthoniobacteraceae bacterium]